MILPKRFSPSFDVMTFSRQSIEGSAIILNGTDGLNIADNTQVTGGGSVKTQPIYVSGFNYFELVFKAGLFNVSLVKQTLAKWRAHVIAYCHDLWGRGGFGCLTDEVWEDWYDTEMRRELTDWEFAVHVALPWVAHHDAGRPQNHIDFAAPGPTRKRMKKCLEQADYVRRTFARGDQIAKTKKEPADADPPPDVGSLSQPARSRGKLRVVYGAVGPCPAPLTGITPRRILPWVEEVTDAFADRGEFPSLTALMGFIHKMADLDADDATAACRVLAAMYEEEDERERREMRAMVDHATRPPKPAPEPEAKPAPDLKRPRPTTKVEVRSGAAGAVTVAEGKKGGKKYLIWGHPVTAILRWMGSDAWTFADARLALKKLAVPDVGDPTVKAQLLAGRAGGDCNGRGPAAALTEPQTETLYALLEKNDGSSVERQAGQADRPAPGPARRPGAEGGDRPGQAGRKAQTPAVPAETAGRERRPDRGPAPGGVRPPDQPAGVRGRAGGAAPSPGGRPPGVGGKRTERVPDPDPPVGRHDGDRRTNQRGRVQDDRRGRRVPAPVPNVTKKPSKKKGKTR